jgi:hypothetical protein
MRGPMNVKVLLYCSRGYTTVDITENSFKVTAEILTSNET